MKSKKYSQIEIFYLRLFAINKYKSFFFTETLKINVIITVDNKLIFLFYNQITSSPLTHMDFTIYLSAKDSDRIYAKMMYESN